MGHEDRGEIPSRLPLATMAITTTQGPIVDRAIEGDPELVSVLVSHNDARLAARRREAWVEAIRHYEREVDRYSNRVAMPL
jgi:hypothetical protein